MAHPSSDGRSAETRETHQFGVRDPSRPRATSPSRTGTFGSADGLRARPRVGAGRALGTIEMIARRPGARKPGDPARRLGRKDGQDHCARALGVIVSPGSAGSAPGQKERPKEEWEGARIMHTAECAPRLLLRARFQSC